MPTGSTTSSTLSRLSLTKPVASCPILVGCGYVWWICARRFEVLREKFEWKTEPSSLLTPLGFFGFILLPLWLIMVGALAQPQPFWITAKRASRRATDRLVARRRRVNVSCQLDA